MATASALLAPGAMRIRGTTKGGAFVGALSGVRCDALEAVVYQGKQRQTIALNLSDLETLEVQRLRGAGWKGMIIAMALGAAAGALLDNEEPGQGAAIGALVLAPVGWRYPVRAWRPIEVPKHAVRE